MPALREVARRGLAGRSFFQLRVAAAHIQRLPRAPIFGNGTVTTPRLIDWPAEARYCWFTLRTMPKMQTCFFAGSGELPVGTSLYIVGTISKTTSLSRATL